MKLHIPKRSDNIKDDKPKQAPFQAEEELRLTPAQQQRLQEMLKRQMVFGCVVIDGSR